MTTGTIEAHSDQAFDPLPIGTGVDFNKPPLQTSRSMASNGMKNVLTDKACPRKVIDSSSCGPSQLTRYSTSGWTICELCPGSPYFRTVPHKLCPTFYPCLRSRWKPPHRYTCPQVLYLIQSQGIIHGTTIYVSGQIPADAKGNLVEGSITEKTRACAMNVKAILEEAGSSLDKVVKCTVRT